MTRYLLDTDTLIDFSKGWEPAHSNLLALIAGGDVLGVCCINVAEFYAGVPAEHRSLWDEFFASVAYWDVSRLAAIAAGVDRYAFNRQGRRLTTADSLIAAV